MRPERRFEGRNGKGRIRCRGRPLTTNQTPPDISLLRAKNGLDNGVHFKVNRQALTILVSQRSSLAELIGVATSQTRWTEWKTNRSEERRVGKECRSRWS